MDSTSGIIIIEVSCPLCGSADSQPVLEDLVDVEDRVPGRYTFSHCPTCDLIYLSKRPTVESLPKCYPAYYHVQDPVRQHAIPRFLYGLRLESRYRQLLRNIGQKCDAILEVGCGDGSFLDVLDQKMPPKCILTGIDFSIPTTIRAAGSRLNLIQGEFEKVAFPVKYDAIVMFGVLEHLANPLTSLKIASEHLTPRGLLFGDTPSWDSAWRRLFPRHWQGLQIPRHQTLLEPHSLRKLLNAAGYDVVRIRYIYDPGDLSVTLCNWITDKLKLQTPPRRAWFYFPAVILFAPFVWLLNLLSRRSGSIEFTARRKS